MINPEIIGRSESTEMMWEGCLSVAEAGLFCKVRQHKWVRVAYQTATGEEVVSKFEGMYGHIAQHELDHLDGKIFLDLDLDRQSIMSASEYVAMRQLSSHKA